MTTHVEDGRLTAYLDHELPAHERSELETHLRACLPCRHALGRVRQRIEVVRGAFALLDRPAPTDEAWRAVQAALGDGAAADIGPARRSRGWSPARWTLARAAGLVLVLAGGAAAAVVPGSPVRAWLFGDGAATGSTAAVDAATAAPLAESGSWTRPVDGRVVIELAIPAGSEVRVIQAGERAGVVGPADARYTSREDGHLAAEAGGGPVRVELPAGIGDATLRVNGADVLVVRGGIAVRTPDDARGALTDTLEGLRFVAR